MIILKSLELNNFISHKDTKIEFSDNQKLLIDGESGSGKSSIIEAIVWSLYGKGRTDNRDLIRRGSKSGGVSLVLLDDDLDILYKIERNTDSKGKNSLAVLFSEDKKTFNPVDANGIKALQEYIEVTILKSSYLLFINSIVYLQDNNDIFVKQTASKKKDILLEIINSSDYDSYLKKTKDKINEISLDHESSKGREEQIKLDTEYQKNIAKDIPDIEKRIEENDKKIKESNDKIDSLKDQQEELKKEEDKIIGLNENKQQVKGKLLSLEGEKKELINSLEKADNVDIEFLKKEVDKLPEYERIYEEYKKLEEEDIEWGRKYAELKVQAPPVIDFDKDIEDINRMLINIMKEEIESCPKCGTPYPRADENKKERIDVYSAQLTAKKRQKEDNTKMWELHKEKEGELLKTKPNVDFLKHKMSTQKELIDNIRSKQSELFEAEKRQININNTKDNLDKIEKEIVEYKDKLKSIEETLDKTKDVSNELSNINVKLSAELQYNHNLQDDRIKNIGDMTVATNALEKVKLNEKLLGDLKEKYKDIETDIESLKLLKEAFGQNGLRAMVIDYILPTLENKINSILNDLSDFTIKIETQKSGAGKDVVIDGLFITIVNPQGEEMSFDNYSGGEKVKISVAINEALAELSKINFRILDETVVSLDNESTKKFLEALSNIQEKVSQIVCISHIPEIKDIFEERKNIVKINGISKI